MHKKVFIKEMGAVIAIDNNNSLAQSSCKNKSCLKRKTPIIPGEIKNRMLKKDNIKVLLLSFSMLFNNDIN